MPEKRKSQANITDEHRRENSQQNSSKQNPKAQCMKKFTTNKKILKKIK